MEMAERNMGNAVNARHCSSCRGLRARHAQKEGTGSWEIPRLARGNVLPWSASER